MVKGNCLDKLCFYNYPFVKTKYDNNKYNNNIYIYIYIYTFYIFVYQLQRMDKTAYSHPLPIMH